MDERGWSEYRLSKEANLSQSTISNIFKRNNAPTIPTLVEVCRSFGITLAQFFSDGTDSIELTEEQWKLLQQWNKLTDEKKKILFDLMGIM